MISKRKLQYKTVCYEQNVLTIATIQSVLVARRNWKIPNVIRITNPRDTVFFVLGPVYPVYAVRESELCYPMIIVLLSLRCDFGNSNQLSEGNLQPLFAVVSFCAPCTISFTITLYVQSRSCWGIFGLMAGGCRKRRMWNMAILQTKWKRAAVHWIQTRPQIYPNCIYVYV